MSVCSPNTGKHGPEMTPYLDTFHAVSLIDMYLFSLRLFINRTRGCNSNELPSDNSYLLALSL